jgi:hypothetical protein
MARDTRSKPDAPAPITATQLNPLALETALQAAVGDARRVRTIDERTVITVNRPDTPWPQRRARPSRLHPIFQQAGSASASTPAEP